MNNKFVDICEQLGWNVIKYDKEIELAQYSPVGEDFSFILVCDPNDAEEIISELKDYYESFEPEEHVVEWIDAKKNGVIGVPDLRTLLDDAEQIDAMIRELAVALEEAFCNER